MHKRKLKRRHLFYYLRVYDRTTGLLIGHLADITTDGMMIMSEQQIATDKDYLCKMSLPAEVDGTREISFEARSVWSKRDVNPDFFATGFQLTNIDHRDVDIIETLIDNFGFND